MIYDPVDLKGVDWQQWNGVKVSFHHRNVIAVTDWMDAHPHPSRYSLSYVDARFYVEDDDAAMLLTIKFGIA